MLSLFLSYFHSMKVWTENNNSNNNNNNSHTLIDRGRSSLKCTDILIHITLLNNHFCTNILLNFMQIRFVRQTLRRVLMSQRSIDAAQIDVIYLAAQQHLHHNEKLLWLEH